jgi:hypothetical protein
MKTTPILGAALFLFVLNFCSAETRLGKDQVAVTLAPSALQSLRALLAENSNRRAGDIQATGSMKPVLDENYILVVEKRAYESLAPGQIALFCGSWSTGVIAHRLKECAGDVWLTKGDNSDTPDPYPMSAKTFLGYVAVAAVHKPTGKIKLL